MSSSITVSTKGMEELMQQFEAKGKDLNLASNKALNAGGKILLDQMKEEVPVSKMKKHHLKDSLKISEIQMTNNFKRFVRVGDVDFESGYIWYVERQNDFMARSKIITRKQVRAAIKRVFLEELQK